MWGLGIRSSVSWTLLYTFLFQLVGFFFAFSSQEFLHANRYSDSSNSVLCLFVCLFVYLHIYGLCLCQMSSCGSSRGSLQRIWPWMSGYKMHLLSRPKAKWNYFHKEQIKTSPPLQQVHVQTSFRQIQRDCNGNVSTRQPFLINCKLTDLSFAQDWASFVSQRVAEAATLGCRLQCGQSTGWRQHASQQNIQEHGPW